MKSQWFKYYRFNSNSKLRLFCFPYAGGSASVFDGWEKILPEYVDIIALQAPGRGERFLEDPISCLSKLVSHLTDEITPYLDVPSIFLGHSNGALTCFELARNLQRCNLPKPSHIILSAKRAPRLPKVKPDLHNLPTPELIKELKKSNGTPLEILENSELMELVIPMLRADFSLSETYQYLDDIKLKSDVSLFCGSEDEDISKEDMMAWGNYISSSIIFHEICGGHFFINTEKEALLGKVTSIIEQVRFSRKLNDSLTA